MTVEAALALCSLMVVLGLALGAVAAVGVQLRCLDAAREAVRLATRGEPDRARRVAAVLAPAGASVEVRTTGDEVEARVVASGLGGLPGLRVTGRAVGVVEPGSLPDGLPSDGGPPGSPSPEPPSPEPPSSGSPSSEPPPVDRPPGPRTPGGAESGGPEPGGPPAPVDADLTRVATADAGSP